ncbi:hypothetical protein Taro_003605 [Colocasia esculenta]|uniref:Uncharacterized protein n=1 Tax=Colocasia esculenta TaxID=4460 RepID=A0A843TKB9_COLES|nr:hypothetical protein [Colocasia esculenta]
MDEDHHDRRFPPSPPSPFSLGCGNWTFFSHGQTGEEEGWWGESTDKVKQALLYATLELETTRIAAQEKIQRMECEVARLRDLLGDATRERDEAREQAHHALLLLDRGQSLLLFQNGGGGPVVTPRSAHNSGLTLGAQFPTLEVLEANHAANSAGALVPGVSPSSSSLSSEESSVVVSTPAGMPAAAGATPAGDVELFELVPVGKLPEKGRLLEAVMKAGPLLQNLMLAGPLPQWRHPPPPLRSIEIPPVSISINSATTTAALPAKPTLTAAATTVTALEEDMKPNLAHHHGLCNNRKRAMEYEEEEADPVVTGDPRELSPPSSSSSSPKISSGSSNTRSGSKYQKIGPFLRY